MQSQNVLLDVIGKFVATAFGGLDDDLDHSVTFVHRFEADGVCHTFGSLFCHIMLRSFYREIVFLQAERAMGLIRLP
jgi:hypothetical protein